MFTYLDPTVRKRLEEHGKLFQIDRDGDQVPADRRPHTGGGISMLGPIPLPLKLCGHEVEVDWYACVRRTELGKIEEIADELRAQHGQASFATLASSMAVNSVLMMGNPADWKNPLVRVHSSCMTGDVFGSERCECGPQLHMALRRIQTDAQGGMVIYMSGHEGRGIGLWAKAATYLLQDAGENTYQANRSLGLPDDSRDFSDAASLLKFFVGDKPIRLMTNNPKKRVGLGGYGLEIVDRVSIEVEPNDVNRNYLETKRDRMGHLILSRDEHDQEVLKRIL